MLIVFTQFGKTFFKTFLCFINFLKNKKVINPIKLNNEAKIKTELKPKFSRDCHFVLPYKLNAIRKPAYYDT